MSSVTLGEVGQVVVESTVAEPISAGATGVHSVVAYTHRAISLVVEVTSRITDTDLRYVKHGPEWREPLEVNPYFSGEPETATRVADIRHASQACPNGQRHTIRVAACCHEPPSGPPERIGSKQQQTSC